MEPSTILVLSTELAASLGEVTARFARSAVATCPSTILLESTESPASLAAVTALSWIIALVMPGGLVATLIVPVFVIGPPVSPAPVPTLVTVPPPDEGKATHTGGPVTSMVGSTWPVVHGAGGKRGIISPGFR